MKKRLLLSISICLLNAALAAASGAPANVAGPANDGKPAAAAKDAAPTYTIEQLYKKAAELDKKTVTVRGEAVKVTSNIQGKNWTHIQDGTGDKANLTHDVICISEKRGAEVGDEVTVTGTLMYNPDSRYKVLIENAVFQK